MPFHKLARNGEHELIKKIYQVTPSPSPLILTPHPHPQATPS
jgi:hypothetical protein